MCSACKGVSCFVRRALDFWAAAVPQGLKARIYLDLGGTAEALPIHKAANRFR
jgi:hypothetical protein